MKKCPYCAEEIQDEAIVCRYCGRDLPAPKTSISIPSGPAQQTQQPQAKKKQPYPLVAVFFMLCVCGLIFANTASKTSRTSATPTHKEVNTGANSVLVSTSTPVATNTPKPTSTPAPTRTRAATRTPGPTRTPQPTVDAYALAAQQKLTKFMEAYMDVYKYVKQAGDDVTLVFDKDWKTKTGLALGLLNFAADEMANLEPSPAFEKYHSYVVEIAKETHLFTDAYAKGIDNIDPESVRTATEHLQNMTKLMQDATLELENIKNNP